MLLLPMLMWAVIACDNGAGGQTTARAPYEGVPEGTPKGLGSTTPDPTEVLEKAPAGQLPSFIAKLTGPDLQRATNLYTGAMQHYDEFGYIPCYCGCAIYEHPHKSLADCYVKSKAADGTMEFTDHSTTCSQCQEGAQIALDGLGQKMSIADIRTTEYKRLGYTQIWTDTPAP